MNPAVVDGVIIGVAIAHVSSLAQIFRSSSRPPVRQAVLVETLHALYALHVEASETRAQIAEIRAARRRLL